jgi:hypothetical protein
MYRQSNERFSESSQHNPPPNYPPMASMPKMLPHIDNYNPPPMPIYSMYNNPPSYGQAY